MKKINREFSLTNENITSVCDDIENILKKRKSPSKEIIKIRFKVEEALYFYQQTFGVEAKAIFKYQLSTFGHFSIIVPGDKEKPFNRERDEYIENIIKRMGEFDSWDYRNGNNVLEFKIPKKPLSQIKQMVISLLCVALLFLISNFLSPHTVELIKNSVIDPVVNTFIGVLRSAAGVLIFTSIVLSIVNIGDIKSFSKIGKILFSNLILFMFLTNIVVTLSFIPWITLSKSTGSGVLSSVFELLKTFLDMIPGDPISPFISGNAIHIIMLAILSGVILLLLEDKMKIVRNLIDDVDIFIAFLFEKFNMLTPVLVFVIMSSLVLSNDLKSILKYKNLIIINLISIAVSAFLNLLFTRIFLNKSVKDYFKLANKTLAVSFLTTSSSAALPSNIDVCKHNLLFNEKIVDLGVPIGQTMFMPVAASTLLSYCVGIANVEGMSVSISWIMTAIILCVFIAIAAPPVPGASLMIISLLISQLNLPSEYIGICITLGCVVEGLVTMMNINGLHYLLAKVNRKFSM